MKNYLTPLDRCPMIVRCVLSVPPDAIVPIVGLAIIVLIGLFSR